MTLGSLRKRLHAGIAVIAIVNTLRLCMAGLRETSRLDNFWDVSVLDQWVPHVQIGQLLHELGLWGAITSVYRSVDAAVVVVLAALLLQGRAKASIQLA